MKSVVIALFLSIDLAIAYKLMREPIPWREAQERCTKNSGDTLAKVTTKRASDLIKLLV